MLSVTSEGSCLFFVSFFKFSDNQTYVKVLTRLQILEPLEVHFVLLIVLV